MALLCRGSDGAVPGNGLKIEGLLHIHIIFTTFLQHIHEIYHFGLIFMNKNKKTMDRLPDYLAMIRDAGMIPGLSAHMPEVIQYADLNDYDVETYIQIYNCMGFLMQVEIESVIKIIHAAKKPVITIKPCAAGRTTPFVGLNFSYNTIREQDMVCIGCFNEEEAAEDIEFARSAIERRLPRNEGRNSPLKTDVIKGAV